MAYFNPYNPNDPYSMPGPGIGGPPPGYVPPAAQPAVQPAVQPVAQTPDAQIAPGTPQKVPQPAAQPAPGATVNPGSEPSGTYGSTTNVNYLGGNPTNDPTKGTPDSKTSDPNDPNKRPPPGAQSWGAVGSPIRFF